MTQVVDRTTDRQPEGDAAERPVESYLLPSTAAIAPDGRLSIGGVGVLDLVAHVGTPVFIYDEEHLRRRCREATRVFPGGVAYAAKAFLCRAMARLAWEEGMAIDVASGGELEVALSAGVPADRLVMHGNNKSTDELARALSRGVGRIVIDSFDEIERLDRLAPIIGDGRRPKVLIRVNPAVQADTHAAICTGQAKSKFGFGLTSGAAAEAVERLRRPTSAVRLVGIHAHIGSQLMDLAAPRLVIASLAEFFVPLGLPELCIGGGLGAAYVGGDQPPSMPHWALAIHQACAAAGIPRTVQVTAEPGRSIVANAAITCYTAGTIKDLPGVCTYLSVDGGMSDNLRPALYGWGYEAFLPRATKAPRPRPVTVVGEHCESGDIVVADGHLPEDVHVGDVVATPVTGAYGYSLASNYNKVCRPPVVFVRDGRYRVVVRRETYDDLLRLDTP
jgi:diaminopimelate decarboxylase